MVSFVWKSGDRQIGTASLPGIDMKLPPNPPLHATDATMLRKSSGARRYPRSSAFICGQLPFPPLPRACMPKSPVACNPMQQCYANRRVPGVTRVVLKTISATGLGFHLRRSRPRRFAEMSADQSAGQVRATGRFLSAFIGVYRRPNKLFAGYCNHVTQIVACRALSAFICGQLPFQPLPPTCKPPIINIRGFVRPNPCRPLRRTILHNSAQVCIIAPSRHVASATT